MVALTAIPILLALTGANGVFRCVGAHGETILSDQPCNSAGNRALTAPPAKSRPLFQHCALTPSELRQRVLLAFDDHDVNALSALFLWRGYRTRSAYAGMRELRSLLAQPLLGIELGGPTTWVPARNGFGLEPAYTPSWLSIQFSDPTSSQPMVRQFPLLAQDGCNWLSF